MLGVQVPLKCTVEGCLAVALEDISVTGNQRGKVPLLDNAQALVEAMAILGQRIPVEPLVPVVIPARGDQALEGPGGNASRLLLCVGHAAVLLDGGEVEHEISLNENLLGLEEEDELLVGVAVDVLVVKVSIELVANLGGTLVGLGEDDVELLVTDLGVVLLGSLLGETLHADDLGRWECLGPFRDEDVVLVVEGGDVRDVATELCDLGLDIVREGDG